MAHTPAIIVTAHGTARAGGALLVAQTPALDELKPLNVRDTERGLALRQARGRPFEDQNRAAADRGPSLGRVGRPTEDGAADDISTPEGRRRIYRKAVSLRSTRKRELDVQHGGPVSTGVKTELVSWASAQAWSDGYYRAGDPVRGASLAEKASGHHLKAIAIAEREGHARDEHHGDAEIVKLLHPAAETP